MTRKYEVVYIFDSALEEEQINGSLERFHELLKSAERPEPVSNVNHWGKRTLAYPIRGKETGYYVIVELETEPTLLVEFERALKLDAGVLRYLVVVNEGEAPRPVGAGRDDDDDSDGGSHE
ncbi:MAG TPA: 30S ribosomal protein S6 [Gemmatimonadales bacterium]|nr:30S ribosomal protein S6 [Gemmatimonadales bacterium]